MWKESDRQRQLYFILVVAIALIQLKATSSRRCSSNGRNKKKSCSYHIILAVISILWMLIPLL